MKQPEDHTPKKGGSSVPLVSPSIRLDRDARHRIHAVRPRFGARWRRPLSAARVPSAIPAMRAHTNLPLVGRTEWLAAAAIGVAFVSLEAVLLLSAVAYG